MIISLFVYLASAICALGTNIFLNREFGLYSRDFETKWSVLLFWSLTPVLNTLVALMAFWCLFYNKKQEQ